MAGQSLSTFSAPLTFDTQVAVSHPARSEGWDPSTTPPEILIGILSSDIRLAVRALRDWTSALGVPFVLPKSRVRGFVIAASGSDALMIASGQLTSHFNVHQPFATTTVLQVEGVSIISSLSGSVYIKYNAVSQQCYVTGYTGKDRGVLLTLGGTLIGHLPLGLLDESMQHAPPSLGG